MEIAFYYYNGNWWLWVLDRWVGYYPGWIFAQNVDPANTLAASADTVQFYGEVVQSEDWLTTTDMGSGEFPEAGLPRCAYIHNIFYYDLAFNTRNYKSTRQTLSDPHLYRLQEHFLDSHKGWGSFIYLGGPGAGGFVGG
jgi:hypothetical protein